MFFMGSETVLESCSGAVISVGFIQAHSLSSLLLVLPKTLSHLSLVFLNQLCNAAVVKSTENQTWDRGQCAFAIHVTLGMSCNQPVTVSPLDNRNGDQGPLRRGWEDEGDATFILAHSG